MFKQRWYAIDDGSIAVDRLTRILGRVADGLVRARHDGTLRLLVSVHMDGASDRDFESIFEGVEARAAIQKIALTRDGEEIVTDYSDPKREVQHA